MSEATLSPIRPAQKRSQPTRKHAIQHAAADAVLTQLPRCAIDLPVLDQQIQTTITLSMATKDLGTLTDSMLNLAMLGCDMPGFKLQQDKTFVENVILAADYRLHQAIYPLDNSIKLHWWGSALSAVEGTNPIEQGSENIAIDSEKHVGANVVIEFSSKDEGDVHYATTILNSSKRLEACESICPGFTHLLYTVLDGVSYAVWPVFTPRTFWNEMRFSEGWYSMKKMCDAEAALYTLSEYCSDEDLAEKYGVNDWDEIDPANAINIFNEEIGGTLPSDFIRRFGRAAVGEWNMEKGSEHESIPDPNANIRADICAAMASMEARMSWCPEAPQTLQQLEAMHRIVCLLADGARLARGANDFHQPSTSAIHVMRFSSDRECTAFSRSLDDLGRGAMESGETTEATGWFCSDMSNSEKVAHAISKLERGVMVLQTTCTLLLDLFHEPNND